LPELRRGHGTVLQYNKDVHIEAGVWVGSGAVILPGVTIGENAVIGAGSVVTRDIPANVVAVGNPCRVIREIGEHDREYFFRDEKIDWNEINEKYMK
jgi:galactoside O-acetyltransferase